MIARIVALLAVATGVAIATVHDHVRRTRLGYEVRDLEKKRRDLLELRRLRRVERERAAAPERVIARATELGVAPKAELDALVAPPRATKP
jgi:hypothetical protein